MNMVVRLSKLQALAIVNNFTVAIDHYVEAILYEEINKNNHKFNIKVGLYDTEVKFTYFPYYLMGYASYQNLKLFLTEKGLNVTQIKISN